MPAHPLSRRLPSWRALAVLFAVGGAGVLVVPHARAWLHLRAGRAALARYHPDEAQAHLTACLASWPHSAEARLLASRAARQRGDFDEADRQLRAGQELLGGSSREVALEWALLQAAAGNPREVEEFLQRRAEQDGDLAPLIWEALIEGHIRLYRIIDALALADHWLRISPDDVRALELRGLAYQQGKSAHKGTEDLRRAVSLDPTRNATRWRLALSLLDMGNYEEALTQLRHVEAHRPDDPDVQVRVARCHNLLGRGEQAREVLDEVLKAHPEHGLALRTRAQFALADRQPRQAERYLWRAVKVWPNDYQTRYLLFQSLQQQNKTELAKAQLHETEEAKERAERLGDLSSRKLSERPLDPALHYEMGVLLLRGGHERVGEGWLLSALSLAPDYQPAHAALASYYQRRGDEARAAEHRRRAGATPPDEVAAGKGKR